MNLDREGEFHSYAYNSVCGGFDMIYPNHTSKGINSDLIEYIKDNNILRKNSDHILSKLVPVNFKITFTVKSKKDFETTPNTTAEAKSDQNEKGMDEERKDNPDDSSQSQKKKPKISINLKNQSKTDTEAKVSSVPSVAKLPSKSNEDGETSDDESES